MKFWKGASLAALLALTVAGPVALVRAGALTAVPPVLGPGRVVTATAVGPLTAPADGRIRTSRFLGSVTGVAWPTVATAGGHEIAAVSGHRLVFSFSLSEDGTAVTPVTPDLPQLALEVGKDSLSVGLTAIQGELVPQFQTRVATGTATYAAAVPNGTHRVVLAMTQGSFTQRFDLWTGALTITDPTTGFSAPLDLKFLDAQLSEWEPHGSNPPAPKPAEAYLWVRILGTDSVEETSESGTRHFKMHTLPPTRLVFTPQGGPPVSASSAPFTHGMTWPVSDDGLFDADYWFVVPGTLTAGTLSVTAGPATGASCSFNLFGACTPTTTDTISAVHLELSFPDAQATPTPQRRGPWIGSGLPPTGLTALDQTRPGHPATAGSTTPGSGGLPVWAAVVVLALVVLALVVGTWLVRWRRRGLAGQSTPDTGGTEPGSEIRTSSPGSPAQPAAPPLADASQPIPETPPLGDDGDLVVRVVGHVDVAPCELPSDRWLVSEDLCAFLALHNERPLTTSDLLDAIWPLDGERGEATVKTVHNTVGRLRQALGAEHLPDAASAGGYRLRRFITDWAEIQRLLAAAGAASTDDRRDLRAGALAHVRGAPFEGAHGTQFHWAYATGLVSEMVRTIAECAHELSRELLEAGDPSRAEWAARQGLRASRDEELLWLDAARAATAAGAGAAARVWRDATAALGAERARQLRRSVEV